MVVTYEFNFMTLFRRRGIVDNADRVLIQDRDNLPDKSIQQKANQSQRWPMHT